MSETPFGGKVAPVNRIIPLSVVDGPGCRTSVFVQGCNIACAYCHNPETQRLCNGCGACVSQCPVGALQLVEGKTVWDESVCVQCDQCIKICPNFASPKVKWMKACDVFSEIVRNTPFIQGITASGGECSLYPEFFTELFTMARESGLTCFLDCNGCVDLSRYPELMRVTDQVMLDVKAWDPEVFKRLTGGENAVVKKNLEFLARLGKLYEVRLVCLKKEPGEEDEVDMEAVIEGVAADVKDCLGNFRLKLITFRNFGVRGRMESRKSPTPERMEELRKLACQCGFKVVQVV